MTHLIVRLIHCLPGDLRGVEGGAGWGEAVAAPSVRLTRAHTRIHARAGLQRAYFPAGVGTRWMGFRDKEGGDAHHLVCGEQV